MKKIGKMIIIIIVALILVGIVTFVIINNGKKAITIERFEEEAKSNGYHIVDMQNDITDKEEIIDAKVAVSEDYSYMIKFYTLKDNETANHFYQEQKELIDKSKQEGMEAVEKDGKNYSTYTLKSDETYMYLSRIENTIIQLTTNKEEQKVIDFIKKLGY